MLSSILSQLCVKTTNGKSSEYVVPGFLFERLLKIALSGVDVDDRWYLSNYPDVKEAINSGTVKTAKEHFVSFGYLEHRIPYNIKVDEKYYLSCNQDVARAIEQKEFKNAQAHFLASGYSEGRLPSAGFTFF